MARPGLEDNRSGVAFSLQFPVQRNWNALARRVYEPH